MEIGIHLMEINCHSSQYIIMRSVKLRGLRISTTVTPNGIYRCDIPTTAVQARLSLATFGSRSELSTQRVVVVLASLAYQE